MKKVLSVVLAAILMLSFAVSAAEITLTEFSVSNGAVTAKGIIEGAKNARASIFIEKGGAAAYISQTEADENGAFDLSFGVPASFAAGNYTAHIGASESAAKTVDFSYPDNKTYISYTPEESGQAEENAPLEMEAVKRVSRVTVSGKVNDERLVGKSVMLVMKKTDEEMNSETVAYIDEATVENDQTFSFEFDYVGEVLGYTAYLYAGNEDISSSITVAKTDYELVSASIELSQTLNRAVLLAKLKNDGDKGVSYTMIIAMYDKNNVMVGMKVEDASILAGSEKSDTIELVIPSETVKIKAMLWNSREEMLPIAKPAATDY